MDMRKWFKEAQYGMMVHLSLIHIFVSCLKYSEQASTCLIAVRSSGKTVLLKTASDPLLSKSLLQEKMVLEMIHQTDSPFADVYKRQDVVYVSFAVTPAGARTGFSVKLFPFFKVFAAGIPVIAVGTAFFTVTVMVTDFLPEDVYKRQL